MRIRLAGFDQGGDILRHLGARLGAGSGCTIQQQIIGLHDAVDGGFHESSWALGQMVKAASNLAIALLASLILLHSPRSNISTMISSSRSSVAKVSAMAPDLRR